MINKRGMSNAHATPRSTRDALPNEPGADLKAGDLGYSSMLPHAAVTPSAPQAAFEYAELKHMIQQQGLLEKQPLYYACKMALLLGLFILGLLFLMLVHSLWLQLLDALYLALVTTQLGLLGHDAGHRQIFRKTWKNDLVGLITGNLLLGMSNGWWMDKHNRHHSHPNQQDLDPDIDVPILSMTGEDLFQKSTLHQFVIKHQAIFFFPVLSLLALSLQASSVRFLILGLEDRRGLGERGGESRKKEKYRMLEIALLGLHFGVYLGVLFFLLGVWQAVLFILVHQLLSGLYLGSIFAPNHKGMPVLEKESDLGFLYRQVVTARNVKAHPVTDFWYGGLNYQIEHHLFPSMPRNRLREAQGFIKAFCQEHAIPYYETSMLRSYQEILQHLHHVSAPLRTVRQER